MKLESLEKFGWRFGLETTQTLLSVLGDPQVGLRYLHVAGSNGKGSTCAFTASFLKQAGYKTGLYTSPHLCDIRERFRINGAWISTQDFDRLSAKVLTACETVKKQLGHYPTHFEALTAIAFCWFQEQKVDWVVLEVGLGGRLDATNIIQNPAVSLIAPIGLEHQAILGKTIEKIAWEKAGIIKPGEFVATVQYEPAAYRTIEKVAREKAALLWKAGWDFDYGPTSRGLHWEGPGFSGDVTLPATPHYQVTNAALALAGIQYLRTNDHLMTSDRTLQKSFSAMRWPGRVEVVSTDPFVILDGAHNPDGAKALTAYLQKKYPDQRWVVLNGQLQDKDHRAFVKALKPLASLAVVTEPSIDRAEKGEKVFSCWENEGSRALLVKDWKRALILARAKAQGKTGLLITGSLYLVGDCRRELMGLKGLEKI